MIDPIKTPPSMLRRQVERTTLLRDEDDRALYAFEYSHDLSNALNGAWPCSLWLVRCGAKFIVESTQSLAWLDAATIRQTLTLLADEIAGRIANTSDARGKSALERWQNRERVDLPRLLISVTGLAESELRTLAGSQSMDLYWEASTVSQVSKSEIVAAARMGYRCLSFASLNKVLALIRGSGKQTTQELDALTDIYADSHAREPFERPFDEGHFAAQWLRAKIGVADDRVEALRRLSLWNVLVVETRLPETGIDAVAAWGGSHGPVVIVNRNGTHSASRRALNVTLAHEICHLILDRREALPVAEVLGGRVMDSVEARARAFAAEFLLPRETAHRIFREEIDRGFGVNGIVSLIAERYRVSKEVVAWQIRNREAALSDDERRRLRSYVRQKHVF
jgi:Zn-dependent peptidase ImmA (M78 family)